MWATTHPGGLDEPDPAPRTPIRQAHRLGGGDLRVPRREARSFGLDPDRRELRPDALAVLPDDDPGPGPLCRRPRLRSWDRRLGTGAVVDDCWRPDRLSQLVLPLHDPDGPPQRKSLRRSRTPADRPLRRPGIQRRRGPSPPRGDPRHRAWPAGSGDPPGARPELSLIHI